MFEKNSSQMLRNRSFSMLLNMEICNIVNINCIRVLRDQQEHFLSVPYFFSFLLSLLSLPSFFPCSLAFSPSFLPFFLN